MKEKNKKRGISLDILHELYEGALLSRSDEALLAEKYMRQYEGSDEIDGSSERALTVRNITFEIIESEINTSVPYPKVAPVSQSEAHDECAKTVERLCRTLRDKLVFEELNDADERYTYIYGGSVFYIEWDSGDAPYDNGEVKVHCLPPDSFIPQPGVYNIHDMEYCFLRFSTTKGELVRKYGVKISDLALAECEYERAGSSPLSDTVNLVTAFYRDADGEVGKAVFSGKLLLSDIPNYYMRKGEICRSCGAPRGECRCGAGYEKTDLIYETVTDKNGKRVTLPYYTPKDFPIVIRRNTLSENSVFGTSDCERIRPEQQAINKVESRILSKLLRAGVTPVMPEDAGITVTNAVFGQVIKLRPGESVQSYGVIDTTPDITADIAEADRLYDQAKRIIGITDALQGTDTLTSESGYARQLKISQASSRLESKRRLKYRAYSEIYNLIFKLYLAFADEPRSVCYCDAFGNMHTSEFSRRDFIECDRGIYRYSDGYIFTVDQSAETEYERDALWERNLTNLESGSLGDKSDPKTLLAYWQIQERARYPFASLGVEHFKEILKEKEIQKESEKNNE